MREQRVGEGVTKREEGREGGLVLVVVGVARWWRSTRSGALDREEDKVHRRHAGGRSSGRLAAAGNEGRGVMQIGHRARQGGGEKGRGAWRWWIGVDPDGDLGDKCGGGRDKCLEVRVWSRFRLESIYIYIKKEGDI